MGDITILILLLFYCVCLYVLSKAHAVKVWIGSLVVVLSLLGLTVLHQAELEAGVTIFNHSLYSWRNPFTLVIYLVAIGFSPVCIVTIKRRKSVIIERMLTVYNTSFNLAYNSKAKKELRKAKRQEKKKKL